MFRKQDIQSGKSLLVGLLYGKLISAYPMITAYPNTMPPSKKSVPAKISYFSGIKGIGAPSFQPVPKGGRTIWPTPHFVLFQFRVLCLDTSTVSNPACKAFLRAFAHVLLARTETGWTSQSEDPENEPGERKRDRSGNRLPGTNDSTSLGEGK